MDSGVGGDFWAEAIATAAYLRNRYPTKALKSVITYEAWTKRKPDLRHLKIFGCKALVIIPAAFRMKLDSKSKECIFVGYSDNTKGYRLVDPVIKKSQIARDVVFSETQFMSSDIASPFDLNDELQERTTIPVVMKKNLVEINDGQREILQTLVEVGTSLSQDIEGTLEVGTSLSQDSEERPRRSRVPNSRIFNKQFVVNLAAQCERGDPTALWETLSVAAAEAIWLMPSAPDLVKIYCDNKGAVDLSKNPSFRPKTKHTLHHFIRERVASGDIQVERLPSVEMIADILTKSLAKDANAKCASSMGLTKYRTKWGCWN